ncbi:type I-B CRISPR-associated protein Cas8b1/Cst1 [Iocasia frigidifontis]|nr:type I-B CRISPR-associated protein Cas8b1/Cst1 [Iocasia fonsfrigidae]
MRILKKAEKSYIEEDSYKLCANYLEVDSSLLENFSQYYFEYFLEEYNIHSRESEKVERYLNIARNKNKFKDAAGWIKDAVRYNRDKVKRAKFENEYYEKELDKVFKRLSEMKKVEQIGELERLVDIFKKVMKEEEVNQKLSLNAFKNGLSSNYFGQPSFLNVYYARNSIKEQQEKMKDDYIKPVLEDVRLDVALKNVTGIQDFSDFVESELDRDSISKEYNKLLQTINKKFIKRNKSLDDIREFLDNKVLHCSIWNQYLSNSQFTNKSNMGCEFTESVFIPLAVSLKKSKNFMWNGNISLPICNLLKLVLLAAPAGATEMNSGNAGFVNLDTSIEELYKQNQNLKNHIKNGKNPFEEVIYDIVSESSQKSKWMLSNILFVEFNAEYDSKSSKLSYFNIPQVVAKYFKKYGREELSKIWDEKFKESLVNLILYSKATKTEVYNFKKGKKDTVVVNNINSLINAKLRDVISSGVGVPYDAMRATVAKYKIEQIKKGCEKVDDKNINWAYNEGKRLKYYFEGKNSKGEKIQGRESRANKIPGLAYRLLNAVNAGNKKQFMDSLLRIYMGAGKEVPYILLNVIHEEEMEFETVAHAFLSGFIPKKEENQGEEVDSKLVEEVK